MCKALGFEKASSKWAPRGYVAMNRYPVVVAAYRSSSEENENPPVYYDDFKKFFADRPGCVFAGDLDSTARRKLVCCFNYCVGIAAAHSL